jgi:hypothetical protein
LFVISSQEIIYSDYYIACVILQNIDCTILNG